MKQMITIKTRHLTKDDIKKITLSIISILLGFFIVLIIILKLEEYYQRRLATQIKGIIQAKDFNSLKNNISLLYRTNFELEVLSKIKIKKTNLPLLPLQTTKKIIKTLESKDSSFLNQVNELIPELIINASEILKPSAYQLKIKLNHALKAQHNLIAVNNKIKELTRLETNLRKAMQLLAEDMQKIFNLKAIPLPQGELTDSYIYTKGILKGLPKLNKIEDNIITFKDLLSALKKYNANLNYTYLELTGGFITTINNLKEKSETTYSQLVQVNKELYKKKREAKYLRTKYNNLKNSVESALIDILKKAIRIK